MGGVELSGHGVTLRPLRRADEAEWLAVRARNRDWLRPWEATLPPGRREPSLTYAGLVRRERKQWREASAQPYVVTVEGRIVGRVAVAGIRWGAECGASIGYWVDREYAGRGITPAAVALASEHAFASGLHRLEIAVRPENASSVRVAQKLGFVDEGLRRSYLFIDGAWRDHRVFARTQGMPRVGRYWSVED
ncbi:GNAT family N-acetyltransferase [Demequina sp. NBRC 110057]|uniref:GNAT family N-acetyltransferase n=1 Tax=Demequina sp. NBRC 110057 TaxID=1570346 RepID=UPI0011787530|nr:GNAT family protein [Demequina sp. NBRC 110057]